MSSMLSLGIDVGSTTVKTVITDTNGDIIYSKYQRHLSKVKETVTEQLKLIRADYPEEKFTVCIMGEIPKIIFMVMTMNIKSNRHRKMTISHNKRFMGKYKFLTYPKRT